MTVHAPGNGVLRCARFALALLLTSTLLAFAPAGAAGATEGQCPPSELTQAEVVQALRELLAFAQQHKDGTTLPSQEQIDTQLAKLFDLVDYFLAYADHLEPGQADVLLSQIGAALQQEGLPAEQVSLVQQKFSELLATDGPVTAEQVLDAVLEGLTPYLLDVGYTQEQIAALYAYLLQFAGDSGCPDQGVGPPATPNPSPAPPPAAPAAPAKPIDNTSEKPSERPASAADTSSEDDRDDGAATAEDDDTTAGGLADTGVDTLLLLGVVAVAMIAGGTALSAGRPRAAGRAPRGRHERHH